MRGSGSLRSPLRKGSLSRKTDLLGRPASEKDRGNSMIEAARKIYQRVAATGTGSDRTVALTKLAIISEANRAEADGEPGFEQRNV